MSLPISRHVSTRVNTSFQESNGCIELTKFEQLKSNMLKLSNRLKTLDEFTKMETESMVLPRAFKKCDAKMNILEYAIKARRGDSHAAGLVPPAKADEQPALNGTRPNGPTLGTAAAAPGVPAVPKPLPTVGTMQPTVSTPLQVAQTKLNAAHTTNHS